MSKFSNSLDDKRIKMVGYLNGVVENEVLSKKIEQSVYNYVIRISKEKNIQRRWTNILFLKLYNSKIISIYSNLKKDSYIENETFLERIKKGEIDSKKIGNLSVYDIFPDNWKDLLNIKSKRDKIKYELKPEAMTNLFKCRRCGSRETSYYEVQTRSADEPMTQFITCLKCQTRWKQ
jgi:DNA-directed RNA polymerase subunit M/transcription elongation factor TFIIS|tara:strand:+ start:610 stop:1140 length:531 start_codon:yes stop_codon:yes gene_type:complete